MKKEQCVRPAIVCLAAGALLVGCSAHKPVDNVAKAELAVDHAVESDAATHASSDLQLAQDKLSSARQAMDREDNDEARRLADEALVHAQLAEAKAKSEVARNEAEETKRSIEELRKDTIVIEKQPSRVIVDRPYTPPVVIERSPAPVIIETR